VYGNGGKIDDVGITAESDKMVMRRLAVDSFSAVGNLKIPVSSSSLMPARSDAHCDLTEENMSR